MSDVLASNYPSLKFPPQRGRGPRKASRGQGLVEFALVLPLLLLVVFGIIELGRLMIIYSSVQAASREAARYGSGAGTSPAGVPFYLDKNGMIAAAQRVGFMAGVQVNPNNITYDRGPGTTAVVSRTATEIQLGDRVNVTATAQYTPLLGLVPLPPFPISSTTSRTIVKEVAIDFGGGGGGGGEEENEPPSVQITSPANGAIFNTGETIAFNCISSDPNGDPVTIEWHSSRDGQIASSSSFSTSGLSAGLHTITCRGLDPDGAEDTDSISIMINAPPQVFIISPNTGTQVEEFTPLTFTGTATDVPDGDVSNQIVWFDNGVEFGTGATFSYSNLSVGLHTITAQATDQHGLTGVSQAITVIIAARTPPVVTILSPISGSYYAINTTVVFQGQANDAKDGDVSASVVWTSSLAGNLGTGSSLSISNLAVGDHTITATATDSDGLIGTATVTIRVVNDQPPTVTISSPPAGAHFNYRQAITFTGTANDSADGNLTSQLRWISSIDGDIGSGGSFSYAGLSAGIHTIIARVTDSSGLVGTASRVIYVDRTNLAPVVTITTPLNGYSIRQGRPLNFQGTALDDLDGDLSQQLRWFSNLSGSLGVGSSITSTNLTVGTHVITATVTDSGGLTGRSSISVIVRDRICPVPPQNATVFTWVDNNNVSKVTWTLSVPSGTVDTLVMEQLSIRLPNTSTYVTSIVVEGLNAPFTRADPLFTASENPVWTGTFQATGIIQIIFSWAAPLHRNRQPYTLTARFQDCGQITTSARP